MNHLKADRRLYVTAERDRVVEEGAPGGAWLLYAAGKVVGRGDAERYGLEADEFGRVTYDGCPALPEPAGPEEDDPGEGAAADGDVDHSDRNDDDELPEWTGRRSLEAYLKQYPTGPKAELAKRHIAARDAGADGGS